MNKYNLTYNDGRHSWNYANKMSLEKAKDIIAKKVAKYWGGDPDIQYTEWSGGDEIEVYVSYYKEDIGRRVAYLNKD